MTHSRVGEPAQGAAFFGPVRVRVPVLVQVAMAMAVSDASASASVEVEAEVSDRARARALARARRLERGQVCCWGLDQVAADVLPAARTRIAGG